jgi:PTS system cellobiose-specific IIB component
MKKLEKYAGEKNIDFYVEAKSVTAQGYAANNFDVIMLGPQVSYKRDSVAAATGKPVGVVPPLDYALGNAENIFKQINELLK